MYFRKKVDEMVSFLLQEELPIKFYIQFKIFVLWSDEMGKNKYGYEFLKNYFIINLMFSQNIFISAGELEST